MQQNKSNQPSRDGKADNTNIGTNVGVNASTINANTTARRPRREFTDEFKEQIVCLYNAGKRRVDLIREYDLTPSTFNNWVKQYNKSGSFRAKDNRTPEENELIRLQKENKQLKMENDILKQAALIFGRSPKRN